MGAYARWRALARDEQRLAVTSWLTIAVAVAGVRALGVERMLRMASRPRRSRRLATLAQGKGASLPPGRRRGTGRTAIGDLVTAVDRAGRYVPAGTCLPKSLALAWMLRGMGVAAAVRIGVKIDGRFEAHAWVECGGVAVTELSGAEKRFATILSS
ncbi:MAG TPA: lasso peptide biosynthesis B2 protein [Vicinamibacterales bacterium]